MAIKSFLLLVCAGALAAQPVTFGVKVGVRLTGDLDSNYAVSESKRYVVGPMVTVRLPAGFRFEFDALYRSVGDRSAGSDIIGDSFAAREWGNSWEFPLLLRRTIWRGLYAGFGYAPRVINGSGHIHSFTVTSLNPFTRVYSEHDTSGSWSTTQGVVAAAGIEQRFGPVRLSPEVRYTHWDKPAIEMFSPQGAYLQSTQDQADILVGISF